MDLSGLTAVTTAAEMKAWLAANCLSPISPVMTGTDLGTIIQKVIDVTDDVPSFAFENGLTNNNGTVELGGTLTGDVVYNQGNHQTRFNFTDNAENDSFVAIGDGYVEIQTNGLTYNNSSARNLGVGTDLSISDGLMEFQAYNLTGSTYGGTFELGVYGFASRPATAAWELMITNGSGQKSFSTVLDPPFNDPSTAVNKGMIFKDSWDSMGLQYYNDYSAIGKTSPRWIPDWGTVSAAISASVSSATPAWSSITGKPTTLSGYGITDAYPLTGNPSGFLTGITSGQVTAALGFTPYNSTNPAGYITSATAASTYVPYTGAIGAVNLGNNTLQSGSLGVGVLPQSNRVLFSQKNATGNINQLGADIQLTAQSDVTTAMYGYRSLLSTAAAAFTLPNIYNFFAEGVSKGAGSTVSQQYGFFVQSDFNAAAGNIGFYGGVPANGTANYNLYMAGSAPNYLAGVLGVGVSPSSNTAINIGNTLSGSTSAYGVLNAPILSSGTTGTYQAFRSAPITAAAAFTLPQVIHYYSLGVSLGSGSAVTSQFGFFAENNLTAATNNYGFYGGIGIGANNNYNLYMGGTAPNFLAGNLGVGNLPVSNVGILLQRTASASANVGVSSQDVISSAITTSFSAYRSLPGTQAASFTLGNLYHYMAQQSTIGSGSAVTAQYGFTADSTLVGATANYGFYGVIPGGASNYNLYMGGAAMNYLNGNLGIGALPVNNVGVLVQRSLATGAVGMSVQDTIQSAVTASYDSYRTIMVTQAAAFTLNNAFHYIAQQGTLGAGSSIINQYGFCADSTIIGATNNYGFYGNIAAGTGRWNLYMNGTALNYLAGSLGIGTLPVSTTGLSIGSAATMQINANGNATGAGTIYGISSSPTIMSDVVTAAYMFRTTPVTTAASFTLSSLYNFLADGVSLGAGSSVTTQYGFIAGSGLTAATNNYGFYGNIAAGTGRWNLYMAGTADNYIAGKLGVGTTSLVAKLNLGAATAAQASLNIATGVLLTTPVSGAIEYDGTNLYYTNSTATRHTLAVSDSPVFTGTVSMPHLKGSSGTPTISASTGAGTSATVSIQGTDTAGLIHVVTGTSPATNSPIALINFATSYGANPPYVIVAPYASTQFAGSTGVCATAASSSGFMITSGNTALGSGISYYFTYQVIA